MIKEAILAHPEDVRSGVSRQAIKNFIHKKYVATAKTPEASFNNHISSAIKKGAEKKVFTLPKGASGKVKLSATAKKPAAKKPAAKKPAAKKTATKAKKPAAAKKTTAAKKPAAAKKTKSSTATKAKKPAAKKTATAKKAAPKKATAAKKA